MQRSYLLPALSLVLLVVLTVFVQSCGQKSGEFGTVTGGIDENTIGFETGIEGIWQDNEVEDSANFWVFEPDGRFFFGHLHEDNEIWVHDCGSYTLLNKTLTLFLFGSQFEYSVQISGNVMTITGEFSAELFRSQRNSFIEDCD